MAALIAKTFGRIVASSFRCPWRSKAGNRWAAKPAGIYCRLDRKRITEELRFGDERGQALKQQNRDGPRRELEQRRYEGRMKELLDALGAAEIDDSPGPDAAIARDQTVRAAFSRFIEFRRCRGAAPVSRTCLGHHSGRYVRCSKSVSRPPSPLCIAGTRLRELTHRPVDLDSVEYQKDNRGGQIRAALTARTSFSTIPQIFVGGEFVGGRTDVFDAYRSGRLRQLLDKRNVVYD